MSSVDGGDAAKEFLLEELRQTIKTIKAKTTLVKLHSCACEKSAPSTSAAVGGTACATALPKLRIHQASANAEH